MKRWASLLLAALLAVGGNEQTFQASGIQQMPVLGQGSYTHPQFFVKEFFVPLVDGVSPIRISIRITTRKVLGALNFTSELGVVGLANISDHITVMVDLKESTRRIMVFPRKFINCILRVPVGGKQTPPEYVVDIGTASVTDAHNLKIYMIDGREHLKITVMGNSFYTHSSELKIFASSAIYLHDIQGRVLGQ